ncbi:ATP-binding protein [Kitasatospora sp. NPDC059463]|uniref:ATP-binding protein n=1 Tax=unclassified Kitasatospora TaxID=2633591 RepID=UPI00369A4A93
MRAFNPPDCSTVRAELRSILHTAGWHPDLLPEPRTPADPYALSGRGLHLVQALTHRFGTTPTKTGKVIWFELDAAA